MRTLIVSDLHLGSISRADLARRPEMREPLLRAAAEVDRVVLLGDVLEMRHGPLREAMDAARPFFEDLGAAMQGRELVLVAGNHDHGLIEPWLSRRSADPRAEPLGVAQVLHPGEASSEYEQIAELAAPARTLIAYPGLWVRPDVYATHGHFLDCHLTVPTLERLSVGVMGRLLRRPPESLASAADYEALGAPMFAWRDAMARDAPTGAVLNGMATYHAWRALSGDAGPEPLSADAEGEFAPLARVDAVRRAASGAARGVGRRALRTSLSAGFPVAVGALNRMGIGPLRADISPGELRRAGLAAMGEVASRMGLGRAHVIFGHTHRPGPLEGDDLAEWLGSGGACLWNTGSWTYAAVFVPEGPRRSPYWPGTGILVEEHGDPQVVQLLHDRTREHLAPAAA